MSAQAPNPQALLGRAALSGFTRLSKGLAAVLLMGYVVSLLPSAHTAFALLPGRTIPFAWNLVTAGLFERHLFTLVLDVVALLFLGRVLEPVWGSREFLRFVLIVSTLTTVCTFIAMVTAYYFTFQGYFLYEPISGFHGVVAGLLVGVKQLMPEQDITVAYVLKFRAKWLPSLFVLLTVVLCFCIGHYRQLLPFILFGTYTSWAYLRFFQPKGDSGLKGDPTDDFAFETFFPEALRPVVGTVATILGRLLCGRRVDRAAVVDEDELLAAGKPLPGSDPAEASRRRERGARALEERLAKAAEAAAAGAAGAGGSAASGAAAAAAPSALTTGASLGPTERSASSGNLADKV